MWRALRIAILLFILATVALGAWRESSRSQSWTRTLQVSLYPINADGSERTAAYLGQLTQRDFEVIERWFGHQARAHGVDLHEPIRIEWGPEITARPPAPPLKGNMVENMLWSLNMRYWAWRHAEERRLQPDIRIYVQYYDPDQTTSVAHSIGLRKGLIGVAHLFATRHAHGSNTVILAHELLHTLGASDKYDPASLQPVFPDGYAEPHLTPSVPQELAEIMGGRIPLSATEAIVPGHLNHTLIGRATAGEIGWAARRE